MFAAKAASRWRLPPHSKIARHDRTHPFSTSCLPSYCQVHYARLMRVFSSPRSNPANILVPVLFVATILTGCKPQSTEGDAQQGWPKAAGGQSFGYFHTPFQDES